MVRVLVAEDSDTVRALLTEILRSDPEIQVVGEARNGVEAVSMAKQLHPDLVTMDIQMPLMDGFEATKLIMVEAPTPIVIVSGSVDVRDVETAMQALRVGAVTVLPKPAAPDSPDSAELCRRFVQTVKSMSQVKVVRRWSERGSSGRPSAAPGVEPAARARIVAIAASTGGPAALCQVLSELPGDFPAPILVVQHIAQGFVSGFASWLNTNVAMRVKVAEQAEPLAARTIYVAPDDRHLGVGDGPAILLSSAAPIGGFRPSATFLFRSVAKAFGSSALAVVLTGMGEDGLDGLRAMRQAGGLILAQDEESSVVFGMPGAVVGAALADSAVPLTAIASRLMRSTRAGPA
jgi:two-component system, chemotaxis family, protein-glutamate methylesterase/glutaminase